MSGAKVCDHGVPVEDICWKCAKESGARVIFTGMPPPMPGPVIRKNDRAGKTQALIDAAVAQRTAEIVAELRRRANECEMAAKLHDTGSAEAERLTLSAMLYEHEADAIEERYK